MKIMQWFFMGALLMVVFSCQEDEDVVSNSKIGNWEVDGQASLIYLDGQPATLQEIGMSVFNLSEDESLPFMEAYLKTHLLGPFSLDNGEVSFTRENMVVKHQAMEVQYRYETVNDGSEFFVYDMGDENSQWHFSISIKDDRLELSKGLEIEVVDLVNKKHFLEVFLFLNRQ